MADCKQMQIQKPIVVFIYFSLHFDSSLFYVKIINLVPIVQTKRVSTNGIRLNIRNAKKANAGTYICRYSRNNVLLRDDAIVAIEGEFLQHHNIIRFQKTHRNIYIQCIFRIFTSKCRFSVVNLSLGQFCYRNIDYSSALILNEMITPVTKLSE